MSQGVQKLLIIESQNLEVRRSFIRKQQLIF